mgnify:CR=1 FL=1
MVELKQAQKLIEESQNILIVPARQNQGDDLGSCLALFFTLKKLGKNANLLIEKIPEKFRFLTSGVPQNFIININTKNTEVNEVRYEKSEERLKIYLNLNKGLLGEKNVSFDDPEAAILKVEELKKDGISLAETATELIQSIGSENNLIDENIATCLLTGIVCYSQNFRSPQTKPKTFETSAFLIEKGANHQKIIQHLYRQKTFPQIKVLGKILEKLSFDKKNELYYASLTEKDFQECQAFSKDLGSVVEDIRFNFNYLRNLLILWESHASPVLIRGIIYAVKPGLVEKVLENYEAASKGDGALFFVRQGDLESVQEQILKIL